MKKVLKLTVLAIFGIVLMTSCKKTWTCDCDVSGADAHMFEDDMNDDISESDIPSKYKDISKSEAKDLCNKDADDVNESIKEFGFDAKIKCKPKAFK